MSTSSDSELRRSLGAFLPAVALAGGIIIERSCRAGPGVSLVVLSITVAVAAALLATRRQRLSTAALVACAAALGAYAAALAEAQPADSITRILAAPEAPRAGAVLGFRGTVLDCLGDSPYAENQTARYLLRLESVRVRGRETRVSGSALLDAQTGIPYGSLVSGFALWSLPSEAANPGQFDYRAYLANSGIDCLARSGLPGAIALEGRPARYAVGRFFAAIRGELLARLKALGIDNQGVLPAVLVGDRSALSPEARDGFVRTGTMHLLAISGMNLAMVAGLFLWLLRLAGVAPKPSCIVTLAVAVVYVLVVGPLPSVVRAGLMLAIFCAAVLADRPTSALAVVSTTALVMLAFRPLELYDAGFQLSFVAVLGLFYLGVPLGRWFADLAVKARLPLGGLSRELARDFAISTGAGVATLPLVAYHFKVVSFIFPLANIIMIPATWAMTVAGFAAVALSFVSSGLAHVAALSASGAEMLLIDGAALLSKVPGAYSYVPVPPPWLVIAACAFLVLCAVAAASGRRVWPVIAVGLAAADCLLVAALWTSERHVAEIVTLSDAKSSAAVLFDGQGRAVLFVGRRAGANTANDLIWPFLSQRGVSKVDVLVETAAADARMRDSLAERISIGKVVRQERFLGPPPGAPLSATASPAEQIGPGDVLTCGRSLEVRFSSGMPINFAAPGDPYFEGLVADVQMGSRRAVVIVDGTDGCLSVSQTKLAPRPDALCLVSYAGSGQTLARLRARLQPRAFVSVPSEPSSPEGSTSVLLGGPPVTGAPVTGPPVTGPPVTGPPVTGPPAQ